jgi:nucleotide-binding universal stress UspA family protein
MAWSNTKKSVLVPFDFSGACRRALHVAKSFVEEEHSIIAMHVVRPPATSYPGVLWADTDAESMRSRAHSALGEALRQEEVGAEAVTRIGAPAEEVLRYAENVGAELIILPSHGRKGIDRWLLGSVAEKIVRHAKVPVLVLRTEVD